MPIDTAKTGAAISAHRQRMQLSQQGLAGLMNVTHQAVSKWEKGLALPDTEILLALAKLFGSSMEDLLTGRLPEVPETQKGSSSAEEQAPVQLPAADESVEPVPDADLGELDFSAVMNMLPFVSTKTADHLFRTLANSAGPDAGMLAALAPFVSTGVLSEYVSHHRFTDSSPEVIASLAPFLSTKAVDAMILGMDAPLPPHVIQMLMPFASTKAADQMVMSKLGLPAENTPSGQPGLSGQMQDKIHAKIQQKLDALEEKKAALNRESPRMRLIRQALENGQYELIENLFDELDTQTRCALLNRLAETGDQELLSLFCSAADELDPSAQAALVETLIKGRLYGELAGIIDELDEAVQHRLLDIAFEQNDPELLHLISEHL